MKADIHPEYNDATITCACGHTWQTRSTKGSFPIDICSACHPFFTGKQRLMDTAGRVERFRKKYAKHNEAKAAQEAKDAQAAEAAEAVKAAKAAEAPAPVAAAPVAAAPAPVVEAPAVEAPAAEPAGDAEA